MAATLGKNIVGIKTCADSYTVPDNDIQTQMRGGQLDYLSSETRVRRAAGDFGTEVKGKKEISAVATVEFYLST
jgi:hypothetical protein